MKSIYLRFDNPNGSQKFWHGKCNTVDGPVIIQHGRVGAKPRTIIIPTERFTSVNAHTELTIRADKKTHDGYYELTSDQNSAPDSVQTPTIPSTATQPTASQAPSVMAALDTTEEEVTWFF